MRFRFRLARLRLLFSFITLRFRLALTANQIRCCFLFRLVALRIRLLANLRVQLALHQRNFLFGELSFLFAARNVRIRASNLNGLSLIFLLNGICRVRLRAFCIGANAHFALLNRQFHILFGNVLFGFNAHGVGLLLRLRGRDCDVALRVCFGNLRILADLLDIVDTHVLDRAGAVLEVLNIEVHDLNAQLLHIGHDIFSDLLCNALPVLNHFLEAHGADDLAHIALEHLRDHRDQLLPRHSKQRLRRARQQLGIGRNLDVRHAVDDDVDEFVRRNRLTGLYVHLHDLQGELIHAFEERDSPSRPTDQNPLLPRARNDVSRIRRRFQIAHEQKHKHGDCDKRNPDDRSIIHNTNPFRSLVDPIISCPRAADQYLSAKPYVFASEFRRNALETVRKNRYNGKKRGGDFMPTDPKRIQRKLEKKKRIVRVAAGLEKADVVLKNAKYLNVFSNELCSGDIAVAEGLIAGIGEYSGTIEYDMANSIVLPGFIDSHIHLESALVSPAEFARAVIPHGTTTVIADPHEIANVMGAKGLDYMFAACEQLPLDVHFMLPSCVPATPEDESGCTLSWQALDPYFDHPKVLGLAEMMDFPGVTGAMDTPIEKIVLAQSHHKKIDGHAPGLTGQALNAYIAAGVYSDHECSDLSGALEKLRLGQFIMIREGTAAHNLRALHPLIDRQHMDRCMFCSDDKHPDALVTAGHIDDIIRSSIAMGADPIAAAKVGTHSAARYFLLNNKGAIAPGYLADFAVIDDFRSFAIQKVFKRGKIVFDGKPVPFPDPEIPAALAEAAATRCIFSPYRPKHLRPAVRFRSSA